MTLISSLDYANIKVDQVLFDKDNHPWKVEEVSLRGIRLIRRISADGWMSIHPGEQTIKEQYSIIQRENIRSCTNQ